MCEMNQQAKKPPADLPNVDYQRFNKHNLLINEDGTCFIPEKQQNNRHFYERKMFIVSIMLFSFACLLFSWYSFSVTKANESRITNMEDTMKKMARKLYNDALSRQQEESLDSGVNSTAQNQIQESKRRDRRTTTGHSPSSFVHLVGRGEEGQTIRELGQTFFRWKRTPNQGRLHGLDLNPRFDDVKFIKIINTGVYLVFAQVGMHGRHTADVHYHCSHETIRRRNGVWTTLLQSHVTQERLGNVLISLVGQYRPVDTQLHMGVFHFVVGDELAVRVPDTCGQVTYTITAENSYLGVVRLGNGP